MNPQVKEISKADPKIVCNYCQKSEINSLEWGPMYQLAGVTVHYFCMLFSAGLSQNGEDDQGILGFYPSDIRKELKRGEKLKCKFCKLPRATIGCSVKNCKVSYHYPCGLNKSCVFHFIGNYESYCAQHKEVVDIPLPNSEWECPICFTEVTDEESPLWPPCCQKKVFHKRCIMEMAKNHGAHFFKCPLCNDKDKFSAAMRRSGVYLPDRDASWESVPNAFVEHTRLYSSCDATICECPKGRDYSSKTESKPWKVVRCGACGAAGIHKRCGNLKNLTWRCPICAEILSDQRRNESNVSRISSRIQRQQYDLSSDEEEEVTRIPGLKEVITEPPQIVESSSTTSDSSSDDDTPKVTAIYQNRFPSRNLQLVVDAEDSDEETSDSSDEEDTTEEIFVQSESKLRQKLESNNSRVSEEIRKDNRKSSGLLRHVMKNMNGIQRRAIFCEQETSTIVRKVKRIVESSNTLHDDNWQYSRTSTFEAKLNNAIVQCCRQSSSTSSGNNETDNVSNSVRTDSPGNVPPVSYPLEGRDTLVKFHSKKKVEGRIVLDPDPEVICESPSRSVKISLKGITNRPCSTKASTPSSRLSTVNQDNKNHAQTSRSAPVVPAEENSDDCEEVTVKKDSETKHEESCIILDDDDNSSDLEIVSESLQPVPCTKTTAFMDMVNKARGSKSGPSAPLIRLGVDDDENDDIEFNDRINPLKPSITVSTFRRPNIPISAAFLRVINKSSETSSSKSHFSGRFSSAVRNKFKPKGDDIETVEILSDDEETSSPNPGESKNVATKCSTKRDRLSPTDPTLNNDRSSNRSKRPKI